MSSRSGDLHPISELSAAADADPTTIADDAAIQPRPPRASLNLKNLRAAAQQHAGAEPVNVTSETARRHIGPQLWRWIRSGWLDEDIVALFETEDPALVVQMLDEAREAEARMRRKRNKSRREKAKSKTAIPEPTAPLVQPPPPAPASPLGSEAAPVQQQRSLTLVTGIGVPRRNPGLD